MTLQELLSETGDYRSPSTQGETHVVQSPQNDRLDPRYWRLSDFCVSSTSSGPSIYLVPGPSISERYKHCESYEGTGFLIMNEGACAPEAMGDVQACDCGILRTDEDAARRARGRIPSGGTGRRFRGSLPGGDMSEEINPVRVAVLASLGLLALAGASRVYTTAPELDTRPVGRQCLTERRTYCAPDLSECHTERDHYWIPTSSAEVSCPTVRDTIPRDIPPTPVYRCLNDAGVWYSWAPCDQEPDPIDA